MARTEGPREHRARVNGVELAWFEWGRAGQGGKASILLVHATGFHARVWDAVVRRLGERHVIAVDQRGHGRSQKVAIDHWRPMGEDLTELVRRVALEGAVGVGHSMGGHSLVEAAAACPGAFRRLLLIDPVIFAPGDYGSGWTFAGLEGGVHPTAKRKGRFASPAAMFERFQDRPPYASFDREALRSYCEYGLLPADDGDGFVLACPPETEASVYMSSRSNGGVYDSIRKLEIPVLILRARERSGDGGMMDFSSSPTWPGLAGEFPNAREIYLPGHSHFLPMEDPDLVARYASPEDLDLSALPGPGNGHGEGAAPAA